MLLPSLKSTKQNNEVTHLEKQGDAHTASLLVVHVVLFQLRGRLPREVGKLLFLPLERGEVLKQSCCCCSRKHVSSHHLACPACIRQLSYLGSALKRQVHDALDLVGRRTGTVKRWSSHTPCTAVFVLRPDSKVLRTRSFQISRVIMMFCVCDEQKAKGYVIGLRISPRNAIHSCSTRQSVISSLPQEMKTG